MERRLQVSDKRTIYIFCVDTIGGGGTEVWVRGLIKSLASEFNICLVSGSVNSEIIQYLSVIKRIVLPRRPAVLRLLSFSILSTFVSIKKSDLIHVVGAITFKKSDLNTIHFYHRENFRLRRQSIYQNDSKVRIVNRLIYTLVCCIMETIVYSKYFSKKIATVSPEMCFLLEKDLSRQVFLTHNWINPAEIGSNMMQATEPYLLFVGGDWERKGLNDVIQSMAKLKKYFPDISLYVAGEGPRSVFEKKAFNLGIAENVHWLGRVPRDKIPYSTNSILVCASSFEVSPLIFLEAASCGSPVISYPTFGTLEAVQDGYLIACKPTIEELTQNLIILLSNKDLRNRMSEAGLLTRKTRDWKKVISETRSLYYKNDYPI